ncbi:hypothetical protein L873DRAFT_467232 [Choiromyces venosus 120613-1]|uniref:Uncharacterized protein n=1 Tax=Choiromyces venosus 120613-1 TaxID=1336337 RepID=A0A3N4IVQ0_9PEZI|nr:hypothetical protein L873DRAFT_467232 [Choiromyces venosus 120613-1]
MCVTLTLISRYSLQDGQNLYNTAISNIMFYFIVPLLYSIGSSLFQALPQKYKKKTKKKHLQIYPKLLHPTISPTTPIPNKQNSIRSPQPNIPTFTLCQTPNTDNSTNTSSTSK